MASRQFRTHFPHVPAGARTRPQLSATDRPPAPVRHRPAARVVVRPGTHATDGSRLAPRIRPPVRRVIGCVASDPPAGQTGDRAVRAAPRTVTRQVRRGTQHGQARTHPGGEQLAPGDRRPCRPGEGNGLPRGGDDGLAARLDPLGRAPYHRAARLGRTLARVAGRRRHVTGLLGRLVRCLRRGGGHLGRDLPGLGGRTPVVYGISIRAALRLAHGLRVAARAGGKHAPQGRCASPCSAPALGPLRRAARWRTMDGCHAVGPAW
ncbi:hypothetical protein SGPA1_50818 [Streptomyces misionensis JCM 4497]